MELQKKLDQKERGVADGLIALASTALITAWKLESPPRSPTYLLKVRLPAVPWHLLLSGPQKSVL